MNSCHPNDGCAIYQFALLTVLLLGASMHVFAEAPSDTDHVVIFVYHHVSLDTPRSTSVTPEVFESHLNYLESEGYTVLSLAKALSVLAARGSLPPRSVAITFDDAYESVYTTALPLLERRGWPFTVFVATGYIDDGYRGYMTWDELRDVERRGGTIGNHTTTHAHLVPPIALEDEKSWRARVTGQILGAQARLAAELERPLAVLAYPYGEFDHELQALVAELGLAGIGQQSGPAGYQSNMQAIPRFPVAAPYDGLDLIAERLRTRPLPLHVVKPLTRIVVDTEAAPVLTARLDPGSFRADSIRCFVAGQPEASVTLTEGRRQLAIVARRPLPPGRSKYNCTAPSTDEPGVYYWYSHLWIRPSG